MDKLIQRLLSSFGVCSGESNIREEIKKEIEEIFKAKETNAVIEEDRVGNLVVKAGSGKEKLMLCTHMDNPGFIVTEVEKSGFVRVYPIGSVKPEKLVRSLVKFNNKILGRLDSFKSNPSKDDFFVDLGVSNSQTALRQIEKGHLGELIGNLLENNGILMGANLHNKLACYILIETIRKIDISKLNKEVYFVFSVSGENGYKGARTAAFNIKPDKAIVLSSIEAEDYLCGNGDIELSNGPVLSIFDKSLVIHKAAKEIIEKTAGKENIKLQYSFSDEKNEGGVIHKEVGGIITAMLGIPCRYMYTSEEIIALKDINDAIKLLSSILI
ncbi:aminopeptidase YpdE [Clostridium homopropionicum DSM 5847]|uniref:Aminopeptidase YpdE n=1 Tax=Clostridium homopropionicum DSM 5847 TaxID=1121318 RepID=A0A0L6Z7S2_9CLOT|nr:hypothetical protein [Clostridium homopropionicum]KOA19020.1 aminopeptidase YpdE [Clostridium homopropionicum DSM 5847]SFH00730.1 endoglucanase [Clostridium homopropionicum]